jgi:hypothetical protein
MTESIVGWLLDVTVEGNSVNTSHSDHHKYSTPNSSWMWPTHHTAPDDVDIP